MILKVLCLIAVFGFAFEGIYSLDKAAIHKNPTFAVCWGIFGCLALCGSAIALLMCLL